MKYFFSRKLCFLFIFKIDKSNFILYNFIVNRKLRLIYEDMKLNPDDAVFSIGDAVEIINAGSGKTIRDYDTFGITNFKKNPRGDRIFSRNDIEYLKNLRNLNDCGFKLKL